MSKKGLFTGLLALLLVFALLGCEQVTSGTKPGSGPGTGASPDDKWTEVNLDEATGFDVFKGKWKSSAKIKQTVENVEYDVTTVQEIAYPASGKGWGPEGEVEIKDGVRVFSLINGAPQREPQYMEIAEFRSRYIQGADVYINQSKTRIKTEMVYNDPEIPTQDMKNCPWQCPGFFQIGCYQKKYECAVMFYIHVYTIHLHTPLLPPKILRSYSLFSLHNIYLY